MDVKSPDGQVVANVRTFRPNGMGVGEIETQIDLLWPHANSQRHVVMVFNDGPDQHADDYRVQLLWTAPRHLLIKTDHLRAVEFQAVKCGDVDISLEQPSTASHP